MTKQDFLDGQVFKTNPQATDGYVLVNKEGIQYVCSVAIQRDENRELCRLFEGNVGKITNSAFTLYNSLMGKTVKARVKFEDCTVIYPERKQS